MQFIFGSIADNEVLNKITDEYDYIFHLACYHGNQSSINNPFADHKNNTITSLKLFDHIKSFKRLDKIVYAGAGCSVAEKMYGNAKATYEDSPVSLFQDSPYSISKIIGEMYGNYYFSQYGLRIVKARFQNIYGPREILGAGQWRGTKNTIWRNVVPTFIWKSLNGEQLPIENGGKASRDFIYVDDIVEGLILCALKGEPGEVFNLATGSEYRIIDLANLINSITGNKADLEFKPARSWDNSGNRYGAINKSQRLLGFISKTNIETGIKKTVAWTKENFEGIEQSIKKHEVFLRT